EVGEDHAAMLHAMLERHHAETDSPIAGRVLAAWPQSLAEFTAVVPRDYQRVIDIIRAVRADGREVDENVMAQLAAATETHAAPVPAPAAAGPRAGVVTVPLPAADNLVCARSA